MNFFRRQIFSYSSYILTAIFLLNLFACQNKIESDAARLAADPAAVAEIKRINANLAGGQFVSQADIDSLNSLREKYAASPDVRRTLQAALTRRGDWAAAEKFIGEIPDAERTNADRLNLARIYLKLGQYEKAVETIKNLSGDKAVEVEAKSLLGQAEFSLGRTGEAAQAIDSVWEQIVAQKKTDEINLRGMIYFHQGDFDRAVETLKKTLEIAPENISANNALSRVYAAKGETANAEIYLAKAQKANEAVAIAEKKKSRLVPLYYQLEEAYKTQKYDDVINLAGQILPDADERNKATLYQYLASAYQAQGRQAEAQNALAEAAKLNVK